MSLPPLLVLVGTVIAVVGAMWTTQRKAAERANFEKELRIRSDAQTSAQEAISASLVKQQELQSQLNEKAREHASLRRDLELKIEAIAQLNRQLAHQQREIALKTGEIKGLVNEIVQAYRDGKLSSQDVERILKRPLEDSLRVEESSGRNVISGAEKK